MTRLIIAACALLAILAGPALAAEASAVTLPWGAWVVEAANALTALLLPALVSALAAAAAGLPWQLRLFLNAGLVERLVRNAVDYALNAVEGAAKDRVLSVPVGEAVLAAAVQRAVDQAPAWLLAAAGGRAGIAEKVFRLLHLDEAATAGNTLRPLLASLAREARR